MKLKLIFILLVSLFSTSTHAESIQDIIQFDDDGIACVRAGQSCTWNSDCCSNRCNASRTCDAGSGSCVEKGRSCKWSSECCSNFCNTSNQCN